MPVLPILTQAASVYIQEGSPRMNYSPRFTKKAPHADRFKHIICCNHYIRFSSFGRLRRPFNSYATKFTLVVTVRCPLEQHLAERPTIRTAVKLSASLARCCWYQTDYKKRRIFDSGNYISTLAGLIGDSYGNRTHATAVKGRCLNRLTNEPYKAGGKIELPLMPLSVLISGCLSVQIA